MVIISLLDLVVWTGLFALFGLGVIWWCLLCVDFLWVVVVICCFICCCVDSVWVVCFVGSLLTLRFALVVLLGGLIFGECINLVICCRLFCVGLLFFVGCLLLILLVATLC